MGSQQIFLKNFHSEVIPNLLSIVDHYENPQTQTHGDTTLFNYHENCPLSLIIEKLEQILNHKSEEVIIILSISF